MSKDRRPVWGWFILLFMPPWCLYAAVRLGVMAWNFLGSIPDLRAKSPPGHVHEIDRDCCGGSR